MTLERVSRDQALERIRSHIREHGPAVATLPLDQVQGLICAQDLFAAHATPAEPRSTVDGYALSSASTRQASANAPLMLRISGEIRPSTAAPDPLEPGHAARILTGGPLPHGADCVVADEEAKAAEGGIVVQRELKPGERVRGVGSDLKAGSRIVRRGEDLGPQVLAALCVSGLTQAQAYLPPRAQVLAIGNELCQPGCAPAPGCIPADNLLLAGGLLRLRGVTEVGTGVVANDLDSIAGALTAASDCQCVVTTGGTGPGERDFILEACARAGYEPLFNGLKLTPGKSVFAAVRGKTLLFALPGTPWAVFALMHSLVLPVVCWLRGRTLPSPTPVLAKPLVMPPSPQQDWEKLVPCTLAAHGAELHVQPLLDRAAETRMDMLAAQGLLILSAQTSEGELVPMIPVWETRRGLRLE